MSTVFSSSININITEPHCPIATDMEMKFSDSKCTLWAIKRENFVTSSENLKINRLTVHLLYSSDNYILMSWTV